MSSTHDVSNPEKLGCRTLAALCFVALVWMLITLAGLSRALGVGWPACITDEGVLAMMGMSLGILVVVLIYRNDIIKPNITTCPKCGGTATRGQFSAWQFAVAICFFPIGLVALLAGRQPTKCPSCNHSWQV